MTRPLLIVLDDDPDLADLVADTAELVGYEARKAPQGEDFWLTPGLFDAQVIVLDVVMPKVDGTAALRGLAERLNRAKIILVSGYQGLYLDVAEQLARLQKMEILGTLSKPFTLEELEALLRKGLPAPVEVRTSSE